MKFILIKGMGRMIIKKIIVTKPDKKNFKEYGEVIGHSDAKPAIENDNIKFWPCESLVDVGKGISQFAWLEIKADKDVHKGFYCKSLERHLTSSEANISLNGASIIIVALPKNIDDKKSSVDIESIKAFLIDENTSINIKKGIWHSRPFPLEGIVKFIVVFEKEVHIKDMISINLEKEKSLQLKILI